MMDIIIVIDIGAGVRLRLPAQFEGKHFQQSEIARAGLALAEKLGGRYSHWEDAE